MLQLKVGEWYKPSNPYYLNVKCVAELPKGFEMGMHATYRFRFVCISANGLIGRFSEEGHPASENEDLMRIALQPLVSKEKEETLLRIANMEKELAALKKIAEELE